MSEAKSWSNTPSCVAGGWTGRDSSLGVGWYGEVTSFRGELTSSWLISYQRNQQRCTPLTIPLISIVESSDLKLE